MFVGHYAVAFALKGKEKKTSLGMLFIATQFVDIIFFPFALLGIEKLNLIENFTKVNNLDLEYVPYTHGLLASILWAAVFYVLYFFVFAKNDISKKSIATIMALAVLSHWFIDLLVHVPDLPLVVGDPKFGFGLWNYKEIAFILEIGLLIAGLVYYLKNTTAVNSFGKYSAVGYVVFLTLINFMNYYILPQDDHLVSVTISALFVYFLFAGLAFWVDKTRVS
jgi:hypothetical protein